MKVKCNKIISSTTLQEIGKSPSISIGYEYFVISIESVNHGITSVRIIDDNRLPSLWDAQMFETIDDSIPSDWSCRLSGGFTTLAPKTWQGAGFWEDYFDRVPDAVASYQAIVQEIMRLTDQPDPTAR